MMDRTTHGMVALRRLFGLGALAIVAGCFTLARPTPPLEEYVLGHGPSAGDAAPARPRGGVTIGLRRLDLAPYLSTTAIVIRRGARIVTSEFRRWGEDPSAGIMRAVALSLRAAPEILAVDVAPWPVQAPHDYLIQLHVSHLEGVAPEDATAAAGEVRVTATWEIIRSPDGALVARGATDRRETGWTVGDHAGLVAKVESGLAGLATDLAACLARLPSLPAVPDVTTTGRLVVCRAP